VSIREANAIPIDFRSRCTHRVHPWARAAALVGVTLLSTVATAAPLTRRRALEIALRRHPEIAAARASVDAMTAEKRQADALRWPAITLDVVVGPAQKAHLVPGTAVQSREDTYSGLDPTVFFRGDLQVLQPLYTFGKIGQRRRAGEHGVRARQAEVELTKADVALEVARLYESFLYARDSQRLFEEIDRIVGQAARDTDEKLKKKVADLNEQDLLRLQTAQSLARAGLRQAAAGAHEALAGLMAYLALPAEEVIPVEDTLMPIAAALPDEHTLIDTALGRRPELAALTEGRAALESLAAAEHAGYYPDFFLLGLVSAAYAVDRDLVRTRYYADPFYHFYPTIVGGLHWTLQGDQPGRRADEQHAQARRLGELRRWAVDGIPAQVRLAREEVERAGRDLEEAGPALDRAKQWLVRATADYDIGLGDSRSVSDAAQGYVLVRTHQLDTRRRWNLSLAELAKSTGTLVTLTGPYPGKDQ
jgi:outer membrane protein TolC